MNESMAGHGAHVADLLPELLNGTLTADVRAKVESHLLACEPCKSSLSTWEAISNATRQLTGPADRSVEPPGLPPVRVFRVLGIGSPVPVSDSYELESKMTAFTVAQDIPTRTGMDKPRAARGGKVRVGWQRAIQIAALLLIAGGVASGLNVMTGGALPRALWGAAPPAQSNAECAASPPSAERLATVLDISGVLAGTTTDLSDWVVPDVTIDQPSTLPDGSPVDEASMQHARATWSEFVACAAKNNASEFGLFSDDGLRRAFYQTALVVTGSAVLSDRSNAKPADVQPTAPPPGNLETVEEAATPDSKVPPASDVPITTAKTTEVAGLELREATRIDDGRIVVALVDPAIAEPIEFAGIVVFAEVDGAWLIDDFYRFYG